jgi:serine/threonine protein kinase/TPR repeat protein
MSETDPKAQFTPGADAASAAGDEEIPSLEFGHYRVLWHDGKVWELGRGAMGVTYKAIDINLEAPVALKLIRCQDIGQEQARGRFVREARAAAALRHPHVATVFHLGEQEGDFFYAMEFVEGETLEAKLRREGQLEPAVALGIARQVASALAAAAKLGIVHRDIKPSNIMLQEGTGQDEIHAKVIDFGLAKTVDPTEGDAGVTRTMLTQGGFLGTPHFASPEQLEEKELDARTDIYSLGVTLFYMLAGQTPFSGSIAQVMSQHLYRQPPLERLDGQPKPVVALVESLLQKDPAQRPADGAEVVRMIDETLATIPSQSAIRASGTQGKPTPPPMAAGEESTLILPAGAAAEAAGAPPSSPPPPSVPAPSASSPTKKSSGPLVLAAIILFLLATLGGLLLFLTVLSPRLEKAREAGETQPDEVETPPASTEVRPALPPDPDASAEPQEDNAAEARNDIDPFARDLAAALALEVDDPSGSLFVLAQLARQFPEEPEAAQRLERRLARLELQYPGGIPVEDLPDWRKGLETAADGGSPVAHYLLAESIFRTEPEAGLQHFLAAADGGKVEAMVRAGSLLSAGRGVPEPDLHEAFHWFQSAATQNHPLALTLLADCYLRGLGVDPPEPEKAVELLERASALGEPRGTDLLGELYRKGIGMEEANLPRAYELFEKAAALGNLDAQGNLGIMVMLGEATPRDPARAMALWNEGARQGNDTCMFFYAQTLEDPALGDDPVAAAVWYGRAARLGHPDAIEWFEQRGISWEDPDAESAQTASPNPENSPPNNGDTTTEAP